jgi:hypothetical protein
MRFCHPFGITILQYPEPTLSLLGKQIRIWWFMFMSTMHTAMNGVLKTNNSVRHLPLAQLSGRIKYRAVAQLLRNA